MRRRILGLAMLAVALAVTLFGVPLALVVHRLFYSDERSELERLALRASVTVSPDYATSHDPLELPRTDPSQQLAVYDGTGRRFTGAGPPVADSAVRSALRGRGAGGTDGAELVAAVPIAVGEDVIGVIRAASPRAAVRARIYRTWAAMLGLGLFAGGCASILAAAQARRLARPLQRLEAAAEDLGAGNFASRAGDSGVGEIDRAGQALNRTARRLEELVGRERAFSAHASHQLRTPLTSLRLGLDSALATPGADLRSAVAAAVVLTDQLSRTIDDVLTVARSADDATGPLDPVALLAGLRARWHAPLAAAGRPLRLKLDDPPPARASAPALRQALDVLLDNALQHGRGVVTVTARAAGDALAIDVADEGTTAGGLLSELPAPQPAPDSVRPPARLGLALARSLIEAQGGRLVHARTEPRTRLTVLLPATELS